MPDFHPEPRDSRASHDPFDLSGLEGSGGAAGNRPAAGARQASPGQVLSSAFHGSATAGDFLGLDLEVGEPGAGGELDLESVDPYGSASEDAPPASHARAGSAPSRYAPALDPALDDGGESLDELLPSDAPRRSPLLRAGLAFALGLTVVAGAVLGPRFLEQRSAPERATESVRPLAGSAQPSEPGSELVAQASTTEGTTIDVAETASEPGELTSEELLAGPASSTGEDEGWTGDEAEDVSLGDLLRRIATPDSPSSDLAVVSQLPGDETAAPIERPTFDASLFTPEAWMTGELVDMVWRDTAVPVEAIAHPVRVMTPRVGSVRVHMDTGEVFEGRLYAVGQNRVWLDGDLGRLGLDGERVVDFEQLHPEQASSKTFESTSLGTGKRVRVQVPGGVLYGRVLSVVDSRVTLITDEGARVVLDSPQIEPLGPSRAILVQR